MVVVVEVRSCPCFGIMRMFVGCWVLVFSYCQVLEVGTHFQVSAVPLIGTVLYWGGLAVLGDLG